MKVIEYPGQNLRNIPQGLRKLAGRLESGEEESAVVVTIVATTTTGEVNIYTYGDVAGLDATVGQLMRGVAWLTNRVEP